MSIENLFKIFKYYKEGKTVLEISFLLGINFTMIKQILFDGRFKILTQIGTPYIQPPFFNFNTFYRLQEYVRIREFNQRNVAKGGGIIPMAPLNVDNFITPYNLDQMEAREGTIGTFYGIPGAKAVTPFDFDDYK
jgi:hypothetical protein